MTSATALIRPIRRAAAAGQDLRFTPDEADLLRAVLELSEADAHAQAHALDEDELLDKTARAGMQNTEDAR